MNKLLFLCTGNYYRSRFAEILFNTLAAQSELKWVADSRGVATERGVHNVGPISEYAVRGLASRGVAVEADGRFPLQLKERDLIEADLIIALDESEHRPYMEARFPAWPNRIEYWHVHDLGLTPADEALAAIEGAVKGLVQRLSEWDKDE